MATTKPPQDQSSGGDLPATYSTASHASIAHLSGGSMPRNHASVHHLPASDPASNVGNSKTGQDLPLGVCVKKFGGTSLAGTRQIARVAQLIWRAVQEGQKPVVVVSAMAGTTDQLVSWAQDVGWAQSPETVGPQVSASQTKDSGKNSGIDDAFGLESAEKIVCSATQLSSRGCEELSDESDESSRSCNPMSWGEMNAGEAALVLSTGEQITAGLLALALHKLGVPARSWTAWQLPIVTRPSQGDLTTAHITHIGTRGLVEDLRQGIVPIVPGFQGITFKASSSPQDQGGQAFSSFQQDGVYGWPGRITTLGRGGSDTTAVALAQALGVRCQIYTDVAGVFTADPTQVPKAQHLPALSWAQMWDLADHGAKVLSLDAAKWALTHKVELDILSTFTPWDKGTRVGTLDQRGATSNDRSCSQPSPQIGSGHPFQSDFQDALKNDPQETLPAEGFFRALTYRTVLLWRAERLAAPGQAEGSLGGEAGGDKRGAADCLRKEQGKGQETRPELSHQVIAWFQKECGRAYLATIADSAQGPEGPVVQMITSQAAQVLAASYTAYGFQVQAREMVVLMGAAEGPESLDSRFRHMIDHEVRLESLCQAPCVGLVLAPQISPDDRRHFLGALHECVVGQTRSPVIASNRSKDLVEISASLDTQAQNRPLSRGWAKSKRDVQKNSSDQKINGIRYQGVGPLPEVTDLGFPAATLENLDPAPAFVAAYQGSGARDGAGGGADDRVSLGAQESHHVF